MYKITIFLIAVILTQNSCRSGMEGRKLVFRDHKSALFTLEEEELSKKEARVLESPFLHPIKRFSKKNCIASLGNLRFKKESSVGNMVYHIFSPLEVVDLCRNIPVALEKLERDQMLVVTSKYNDIKGVVSNYHRTTFAIFQNKRGFNIVFREIHGGMADVDTSNYYEWSRIPDLHILKNYEVFQVEEEEYISFAQRDGFENRLWVIIDPKVIDTLTFKPRESAIFLQGEEYERGLEEINPDDSSGKEKRGKKQGDSSPRKKNRQNGSGKIIEREID